MLVGKADTGHKGRKGRPINALWLLLEDRQLLRPYVPLPWNA